MDSIDITEKQFVALLQLLTKSIFHKEDKDGIKKSDIKQAIFANTSISSSDQDKFISDVRQVLTALAFNNINPREIENYFSKNTIGVKDEYKQLFIKFWEIESYNVHSALVNKSRESVGIKTLNSNIQYRIDYISNRDMANSEADNNRAIIQLNVNNNVKNANEIITFEADRNDIHNILQQLEQIKSQIEQYI